MSEYRLRKEDLSFIDRAPVVRTFAAVARARRASVFAALADPTTWASWYPGVRRAYYSTAPPHGIGTIREADVSGTHWVEEMIAWDVDRRWAYSIVRATAAVAWAQVESFDLDDVPEGTRVRWTLAYEPRLLMRIGAPIAPLVMGRIHERAMQNLGAFLGGTASARSARMDIDRWTTRLNPAVAWLLRSPLHPLLDRGLLLITVTGRRTGRRYTIPVGYQQDGDRLHVLVSKARRKQWWRNYVEPRPIEVHLRGEVHRGEARVVDPGSEEFRSVVAETLRRLPFLGRQLGIAYDRERGLSDEQWREAAADTALVAITLAGPPPR